MFSEELLVVDLDGTLIQSDMLHESFWSAFSKNWLHLFFAMLALGRGKAALKEYLCSKSDIDYRTLPYHLGVIAFIKQHRKQGGRTALVTATHQVFARHIAEHLGLFDEVYGSDGGKNLKGPAKATFLLEKFGAGNFIYMGDAAADLPVWQVSNKILTVDATPFVRQQVERLGKPIEHLGKSVNSPQPYIKALRPHQWLKNLLIFLPMLSAHQFDSATAINGVLAFIAFSFVASSVYVLNDLLDLNADRAHPRKRFRSFASGTVPISHGSLLALALLGIGLLVATILGWIFLLTLVAYYMLTSAYSLSLKRIIIVDIGILAGLYTMRIFAGGVAMYIQLSVWLLAFSIFFFFSLAAVKRQAELVDMKERGRSMAKGRGYHVEDLPIISTVGLAAGYVSVLVMALYVNSPSVLETYAYPPALWGICCVLLYWLTRMVLITHRGLMHDDPIVFATKDMASQISLIIMLGLATVGALL